MPEKPKEAGLLFEAETFAIRGAVYEVYRQMGPGFLEPVYQECLQREFSLRGIPFRAQPDLSIAYKGQTLGLSYRPDFVCYDQVIVELKAVSEIGPEHRAQVFNYLKATGLRSALLVNFGHYPKATVERVVI